MPRQHKDCPEHMCRCYEFGIYDGPNVCIDYFILANISTSTYTSATDFLELSFADYNEKPLWQYGFPALGGLSSGTTSNSDEPSKDVAAGSSKVPVSIPQDKQIIVTSDDDETTDESDSDVEEVINTPLIISGNGETLVGSTDIDKDYDRETVTHRGYQDENGDNDKLSYYPSSKSVPSQQYVDLLEEPSEGVGSAVDPTTQPSRQSSFDSSFEDDDGADYQPKSEDDESEAESEEYHPSPKASRASANNSRLQGRTSRLTAGPSQSRASTSNRATRPQSQPNTGNSRPPRTSAGGRSNQIRWPEAEVQEMSRHITDIMNNERPLGRFLGESIYQEVAVRLERAGYPHREWWAVKAKWNRLGRLLAGVEERKNQRKPGLQTSVRKRPAVDDDEVHAGHGTKRTKRSLGLWSGTFGVRRGGEISGTVRKFERGG
jgi:hypothetical protein